MATHRRQFLRLFAAAGIGALAGCSTSSQYNEGSTTDEMAPESTSSVQSPTATLTPKPTIDSTLTETDTSTNINSTSIQQSNFAPDDLDAGDSFGYAVAMSGDGTTALIGASGDEDPNGEKAGSAYVFNKSGGSWSQQAKLAAEGGESGDTFGRSVAVSTDGTTALIGAPQDGGGTTYVFKNGGGSWNQQARLAGDDGDGDEWFGVSVAVSNDGTTALVGASQDEDPNGQWAGSAFIFNNSAGSWTQQAKIAANDGDSKDSFGISVAVSSDGKTAIIGARADEDPNSERAGSAYIFAESNGSWTQQAKLAANDGDSEDWFGRSVAMSNDGSTVLISAPQDEDPNGEYAGSAYVFSNANGSWTQQTRLIAEDGDSQDGFGASVAMSKDGTIGLIGAPFHENPKGQRVGSAYVFDKSGGTWSQEAKLVAENGDDRDFFAHVVALSENSTTALIGSGGDVGSNGKRAGSAYVFE